MESREILWLIDPWIKKFMYFSFILSMIFFIKGFYPLFRGSKKGLTYNIKEFLSVIFFQGKLFRKFSVGVFHSLIYYSFFILWIATELVAIHYDTPFKVFQGKTYLTISFLADLAGVILLIGLFMAFKRRFIRNELKSKKPEFYMGLMLTTLVLLGFILEAIRIQETNNELDQIFSPVGYLLSLILPNLTDPAFYKILWIIHMIQTMIFIGAIPYTRFKHFILGPILALLESREKSSLLRVLNFEQEDFGLKNFQDLSFKQKLQAESCVECQRCTEVCPAQLEGEVLDPKMIILKLKNSSYHEGSYSKEELDSCTTCGACMQECPMYIEHVPVIMDLKRYQTMALALVDPLTYQTQEKVKNQFNPWGYAPEERDAWAKDLAVPRIEVGKKVDYLYYIGCAGSYEKRNQQTVKALIALLNKAKVSYAILGKGEKCTGDPLRRTGDEYAFTELAQDNIKNLKNYSFDFILTHCPHCLHTIKEYEQFDGKFSVIHHTELIYHLIQENKIKAPQEKDFTYHDPCYLGRHHGIYEEPRKILGAHLQEMEQSRDKSLCCGMGGGNMWRESSSVIPLTRLKQVEKTKSKTLVTACSFCLINFDSHKKDLELLDLAEMVLKYND